MTKTQSKKLELNRHRRFVTNLLTSGFVLSCVVWLTSCGVKQEEHQRVLKELEQSKAASADAKNEIEQLREKLRVLEQEHRHAQESSSRKLTAYEWWPLLKGKSTVEIKEQLGVPYYSTDNDREWSYFHKAVAQNSGATHSLLVYFRGGRVVGVRSTDMNSIIQE
ncbi:MAG: hypothetical protein IH623_14595 [Verrucomicrobia bacterium]|nr:hypothetical protein [Verrucomicrobiota bacterium]